MPSGPLGGPRPFSEDTTQVLLEMNLTSPVNMNATTDRDVSPQELEGMLAKAGINRSQILAKERRIAGSDLRAVIVFPNTKLTPSYAVDVQKRITEQIDPVFRDVLVGSNHAPYTMKWKCSTPPDIVSGKDVKDRIERSAKRGIEKMKSGVKGPAGVPRPFSNPDGLIVEYKVNIVGGIVDTDSLEGQILNMETGGNLPAYDEILKVVPTPDLVHDASVMIDGGGSGVSRIGMIQIEREMPKRIERIQSIEMFDSLIRCGN